jgi:hypothetical protein
METLRNRQAKAAARPPGPLAFVAALVGHGAVCGGGGHRPQEEGAPHEQHLGPCHVLY